MRGLAEYLADADHRTGPESTRTTRVDRLIMGGGTTSFTDPDGFEWQPATAGGEARSA